MALANNINITLELFTGFHSEHKGRINNNLVDSFNYSNSDKNNSRFNKNSKKGK